MNLSKQTIYIAQSGKGYAEVDRTVKNVRRFPGGVTHGEVSIRGVQYKVTRNGVDSWTVLSRISA